MERIEQLETKIILGKPAVPQDPFEKELTPPKNHQESLLFASPEFKKRPVLKLEKLGNSFDMKKAKLNLSYLSPPKSICIPPLRKGSAIKNTSAGVSHAKKLNDVGQKPNLRYGSK